MASTAERDRRYAALRAAMAQAGVEALIVCARGDEFQRGRLQYVSDLYMWAGRGFLVLPFAREPILFQSRSVAWAQAAGWVEDNRSAVEPPRAIAEALIDLGLDRARLGLVGMADVIAVQDLRLLEQGLPAAKLEDATMLFDAVRAIKSAEEIGYLRETSEVLKRAYTAMEAVLRPGVTERLVIAEGQRVARLFGCLDGIAHLGRTTGLPMIRPPDDSVVAREDVVTFDLEFAGPHGYWLELSRQYSFGPPPDKARRIHAVQADVYQRCVEQMKPGVASRDILAAAGAAYRAHGYSAAGPVGYHAHGIGLDSLEPPWVPGIDMTLEAGMVISLHPHLAPPDPTLPPISIEDNILVTAGGGERLTDPVNRWIEL